jgi:tight adherence protein C
MFLVLTLLCFFISLSLFTYSYMLTTETGRLEGRMRSLLTPSNTAESEAINEVVEKQYESRLFSVLHAIASPLTPFVPPAMRQGARQRLIMAGLLPYLKEAEFVALQIIFIGLAVVVTLPLFYLLSGRVFMLSYALPFLIFFIIAILPSYALSHQMDKRQKSIRKTLPDVVDLLVVSVEAGAGFDGAMMLVSEKMEGPLAQEFDRSLQEMKLGKPRAQALRDMAARTGVPDVASFVSAVCQADQLGVGMAQVLRMQTQVIRQKRINQMRELAQKLPVKLYFPLVLFIFPTIGVVLLGPGMIVIMNTLFK